MTELPMLDDSVSTLVAVVSVSGGGVLVAGALIVLLVLFCCTRKRKPWNSKNSSNNSTSEEYSQYSSSSYLDLAEGKETKRGYPERPINVASPYPVSYSIISFETQETFQFHFHSF